MPPPKRSDRNKASATRKTSARPKTKAKTGKPGSAVPDQPMRLNKYVAHAGICSRRQAVEHIKDGLVTVNEEKILEPGYEVQAGDVVRFKGNIIQPEERKVYLLMNKPKGVITTLNDEKGRKTVLDLIRGKIPERVYPVGRLDRETVGLLLLTNDGDLAKRLSHPSHKAPKIYYVTLEKNLKPSDLDKIMRGVELEDGLAEVDKAFYLYKEKRDEVAVEIHIGRNRIVRRIFESLGYPIKKLDRVYYAGLTKKDLPRGFWRHLTEQEVIMLKHFV